jgi:hypothetical protein
MTEDAVRLIAKRCGRAEAVEVPFSPLNPPYQFGFSQTSRLQAERVVSAGVLPGGDVYCLAGGDVYGDVSTYDGRVQF